MTETCSATPHVELNDLHVRFDTQLVLRAINLAVPRGETIAIIGESGCGKSVLLKSIMGLIRPVQGKSRFDGQDVLALGDKKLTRLRSRFGFVFQQAALFDSLTVAENVAFPLRRHAGHAADELAATVRKRLAEVGLPPAAMQKKPAELSGGMRKRVGLARALAMNPEIILYDEPTTGLDPIMSDVINELILRTKQRDGVTSIIVTHDMRTVRKVAERVVMLYPTSRLDDEEPQIMFDGPTKEIFQCRDSRVSQFVRGEAGERLAEMADAAE